MIFKRRDARSIFRVTIEFVWPKGGWLRAIEYIKHRVRRLPDTPEKIARGLSAGVFVTFTPFFGLHFLAAFLAARAVRGNVPAALIGTFFGNPLTYVPIATVSLSTGYFLLDTANRTTYTDSTLGQSFAGATSDLWHNLKAFFFGQSMDWSHVAVFYKEVFLPFTVGSVIPGLITAVVIYFLALPLISAYQKARRKILQSRLARLKNVASQSNTTE